MFEQILNSEVADAVATIIITVLSWWLGHKKGAKERRKYPSRRN